MVTKIKIAGLTVLVNHLFGGFRERCRAYICDGEPDIEVNISSQLIEAERLNTAKQMAKEGKAIPNYSDDDYEFTAIYREIAKKLIDYNAFIFHGVFLTDGANGFLFSAKSGVGKTTHAKLWLKNISGTQIINGDKPIIRIIDGIPYAFGTPWMGKENFGVNESFRLDKIAFINRGEVNRAEKLSFIEALPRIIESTNITDMAKIMGLYAGVSSKISCYRLFVNMDDEAARVTYEGMTR